MTAFVPLPCAASEVVSGPSAATAPDATGHEQEAAGKSLAPTARGPGRFPQVLDGFVTKGLIPNEPAKKPRTGLPPWIPMLAAPALAPPPAKDPLQFVLAPLTPVGDSEPKVPESMQQVAPVDDPVLSLPIAKADLEAASSESGGTGPVLASACEKDGSGAAVAGSSGLPLGAWELLESRAGIREMQPMPLPPPGSDPQPQAPQRLNPVAGEADSERWQSLPPEPLPPPAVATETGPIAEIGAQQEEGHPPAAVAFAVRLTPIDSPKVSSGRRPDTGSHPGEFPKVAPEVPAASAMAEDTRPEPPPDTRPPAQRTAPRASDADKGRDHLPEAPAAVRSAAETPQGAAVLPAAETARDSARAAARPPAAEPLRPAAEAVQPGAAHPAPPAAAREIHLKVSGAGEPHVEVRVSERAGAVQVAVRTPDSRLAGVLRDDLPALSARLEQTGFRAETWQPAAAAERHPQMVETRSAGATQNDYPGRGQSGHSQQQGQESPRRPPAPPPESASDTKGFSWLLSSFR